MKARDLFIIILKVFGIYLLKDVLLTLPAFLYNFLIIFDDYSGIAPAALISSFLLFAVHLAIVYLLLFHGDYLVSKLKLSANLSTEQLTPKIHRSSIYTIAILISGIIILVFAIPVFVRELYYWSEFLDSKKYEYRREPFNYSRMLTAGVEIFIGFLFLGNQQTLVNFIESRRRASTRN
jgi:hypothetical protein